MAYELKEHEADMGIVGIGDSLEEAFVEGAKAMFSIMINLDRVEQKKGIDIKCEAPDEASLFVEWLNELLSKKDIENVFFSDFKIEKIEKFDGIFRLNAKALGDEMDLNKHEVKTEVKAATYSGLDIKKEGNKYLVQCVVDV